MLSNLRFACRTLTKSPGFALTSVAALALGVGANTAIFSLVNQLLLNPPGISNPDRIVAVRVKYDKFDGLCRRARQHAGLRARRLNGSR